MNLQLILSTARNSDGSIVVPEAEGSEDFYLCWKTGKSISLQTQSANTDTVKGYAGFEVVLPDTYTAGNTITVAVNANYISSAPDTADVQGITTNAFAVSAAGTFSSNLLSGESTITLTPTPTTYTGLSIAGTGLAPGSKLFIEFGFTVRESQGYGIYGVLNSVELTA